MEAGLLNLLRASQAPQLNREYQLRIVQEPQRARMCGHGDKDRRPITPPLIVQLVCLDSLTGEAVPADEVDTSFLIMSADLRTDDLEDANLIPASSPSHACAATFAAPARRQSVTKTRHSHSNSISSTASSILSHPSPDMSGYSPASTRHGSPSECAMSPPPLPHPMKRSASPHDPTQFFPSVLLHPAKQSNGLVCSASHSPPTPPHDIDAPSPIPSLPTSPPFLHHPSPTLSPSGLPKNKRRRTSSSNESFIPYARDALAVEETVPNLIGSLHTSAFQLKDEEGKAGIFFFWPDLSVRTEGVYRLRLRFLSIGSGGSRIDGGTPIVAATYSQPFTVTSAKRFEGMLDPTPMSKNFAKQGIRIPTRKVKSRKKRGGEEEEEEH